MIFFVSFQYTFTNTLLYRVTVIWSGFHLLFTSHLSGGTKQYISKYQKLERLLWWYLHLRLVTNYFGLK